MCGIAGLIARGDEGGANLIERLVESMRHRGPDGNGSFVQDFGTWRVALGHTRLAIIDPTDTGRQPMIDPGTRNALVFNGVIYNYRELRVDLEREGFHFRSRSDTEVLLAALTIWGEDCFVRLRGMYAFAFLDHARKRLVLARDPLGIKPLFIAQSDRGLGFASEVRALNAVNYPTGSLDRRALAELLAYGAVQQPVTMFERVRALAPGSYLEFTLPSGEGVLRCHTSRHWQVPKRDSSWKMEDAIRQTRDLVSDAVASHLVSDVPVGVCLSSGLDSTIVSALAARDAPDIKAFSIGFPDYPDLDESLMAARYASVLGLRHGVVRLSEATIRESMLTWFQAMDQPCLDGFNTYLISRALRASGIKVALSGQGGDELFGGYPSFTDVPRLILLHRLTSKMPEALKSIVTRALSIGRSRTFTEELRDVMNSKGTPSALFLQRRRLMSASQLAHLGCSLPEGTTCLLPDHLVYEADAPDADLIYAVSGFETCQYLARTLLPIGDVSSMATGLELRLPLVDTPLISKVLSMPGEIRMPYRRGSKHLLRTAFHGLTGSLRIDRRKRGFALPLSNWMRGELRHYCEQFLDDLRKSGWVDPGGVNAVWTDFLSQPESPAWSRAWLLCVLGAFIHFSSRRT